MSIDDDAEARILDKVAYVEEAVTVLVQKRALDETTYLDDREQRAIVEREFQTAIEACLDIAGILIAQAGEPMPETNTERFGVLEEVGVLSPEVADRMRTAAGFRNVLAHTYGDDVDDELVYRHLQTELEWLVRYLREVREFLDTPSTTDG